MIGTAVTTAIPDKSNDQRQVHSSERIAVFYIKCYKENYVLKMAMLLSI
jgi:hypothetical protein